MQTTIKLKTLKSLSETRWPCRSEAVSVWLRTPKPFKVLTVSKGASVAQSVKASPYFNVSPSRHFPSGLEQKKSIFVKLKYLYTKYEMCWLGDTQSWSRHPIGIRRKGRGRPRKWWKDQEKLDRITRSLKLTRGRRE